MLQVFPDYYKEFRCIAGACRHSCCIGWEIDIDPETLAFYDGVSGELGRRLRANIARDGDPHFVLGAEERCPFLNGDNLCEIILTLGEEHLCGICADHPRFRNELPGRVETGLGLCCEAAAALILGKREPVRLEFSGDREVEDKTVILRDTVLAILQDRALPIPVRVEKMLRCCGARPPHGNYGRWADFLLTLERLDETWTERLQLLRDRWQQADPDRFDTCMADRQTEYEQLLVCLVYRHLANGADDVDVAARAAFAALAWGVLRCLGALLWAKEGTFTFADQVELVRLFSSEIEYSEENLNLLLDELC